MRLGLAAVLTLLPGIALAAPGAAETRPAPADPSAKVERCSLARMMPDGIEARFERGDRGFVLRLSSDQWRLGRDDVSYQVELDADGSQVLVDAETTRTSVAVPLRAPAVLRAIRAGTQVEVRGEGSSVRATLEGTKGVLESLERCHATRPAEPAPKAGPAEPSRIR